MNANVSKTNTGKVLVAVLAMLMLFAGITVALADDASAASYTEDSLQEALNAEGAEEVTLSNEITLTKNLTIPEGVTLEIDNNGRIVVAKDTTLTVNGIIQSVRDIDGKYKPTTVMVNGPMTSDNPSGGVYIGDGITTEIGAESKETSNTATVKNIAFSNFAYSAINVSGFGPVAIENCSFTGTGAAASAIYSFIVITLRANQNVTGLALSIFGTGIGQFVGEYMRVSENGYVALSNDLKDAFSVTIFPDFIVGIPVIGRVLFSHTVFFYFAILLAVVMYVFLKKTRYGLYLTAVGESPATSDAAGINITAYKYIATTVGGGISAIGGMVYIMTTAGCVWNHEGLSGVGWLAVALVIFCIWRPLNAIWGSVLFGAMMIMYLRVSIPFIPTEIYKILPYIVTVIVLILTSMKNSRDKQPPASLGVNYFREER